MNSEPSETTRGHGRGRGRGRINVQNNTADSVGSSNISIAGIGVQITTGTIPKGPTTSAPGSAMMEVSSGSVRGRGRGRGRINVPNNTTDSVGSCNVSIAGRGGQITTKGPTTSVPGAAMMEVSSGSVSGKPIITEMAASRPVVASAGNPQSLAAGPVPASSAAMSERGQGDGARPRDNSEPIVGTMPKGSFTKKGRTGNKINVRTNYYKVVKLPTWTIYQYHVDFSPDVDMIGLRRAYLAQHKNLLGAYIFDGSMVFSTHLITKEEPYGLELELEGNEGKPILIKIKFVGVVLESDGHRLHVFNIIFRRALRSLKLQKVGRNYYDASGKVSLEELGLNIWPGYETSIRQNENEILLCVEIAHKVMRTDTLHAILLKCARDATDFQSAFKNEAIGIVVLTSYNNRTYLVNDVDFERNPLSTFSTKDGEIRYIDYYKQRYGIDIRDHKQPLLISIPKDKDLRGGRTDLIMLVPELCIPTGITDAMRSNYRLMTAMSEHTKLTPDRRLRRLEAFNKRLQTSQPSTDVFHGWDLKLDTKLVEVPARVLPYESIHFGNSARYLCDAQADWSKSFHGHSQYTSVIIKRWFVVVPKCHISDVKKFVELCIRSARDMSMEIEEPVYVPMNDDRNGSYCNAIESVAARDPQLVMCVLSNGNSEKYDCIKKKCCIDRPMPSQVITMRTIARTKMASLPTKIAIQMNAKLRGAPWMIHMPLGGLMIVGFDVCHSNKTKNKSYGALVATMDMKRTTKYYSAVAEHIKGQELSHQLAMHMECAVKSYEKEHNQLPARIVFYRDGVGDGQLCHVYDTEVEFLKKHLNKIYQQAGVPEGCRLVFIVVTKRIRTRIFAHNANPLPGTVVDDVITLPERYDFFLVSQSVRHGTATPTNYNVISDNAGLDADKLQILSYKMTHLYYNWAGTCRVPAVCQYAHRLAFLAGEHLQRAPSQVLENQLYFL